MEDAGKTAPVQAAPKSRDERLRDFYAQHCTTLEESTPWQLQTEEKETHQLRKKGNDLFEAQDYEAAVEHYTAAIKNLVEMSWQAQVIDILLNFVHFLFSFVGGVRNPIFFMNVEECGLFSAEEGCDFCATLQSCSSIHDAGLVESSIERL